MPLVRPLGRPATTRQDKARLAAATAPERGPPVSLTDAVKTRSARRSVDGERSDEPEPLTPEALELVGLVPDGVELARLQPRGDVLVDLLLGCRRLQSPQPDRVQALELQDLQDV